MTNRQKTKAERKKEEKKEEKRKKERTKERKNKEERKRRKKERPPYSHQSIQAEIPVFYFFMLSNARPGLLYIRSFALFSRFLLHLAVDIS